MSKVRALLELAIPAIYEGYKFISFKDSVRKTLDDILDYNTFINKNQSILYRIDQHISNSPKLLGQGISGAAFDIGNNKVLKFFTDPALLRGLLDSQQRYKSPEFTSSEPEIFEVGQLTIDPSMFKAEEDVKAERIPSLYFSVMEKLNQEPLTQFSGSIGSSVAIGDVFRNILSFVRDNVESIVDTYMEEPFALSLEDAREKAKKLRALDSASLREFATAIAKQYREQDAQIVNEPIMPKRSDPDFDSKMEEYYYDSEAFMTKRYHVKAVHELFQRMNLKLNENWLENYILGVITRYFSKRQDLHPGNIGHRGRDGNFVYFDDVHPDPYLANWGSPATNKIIKLSRRLYLKYLSWQ